MSSRLIALNVLLRELEVPFNIQSLRSRKTIQKAIYLAQAAGIDLGYRYGWYVHGPYSPGLTTDYYETSPLTKAESEKKRFKQPLMERAAHLKSLFQPPSGVDLEKPEWMELLSSVHYLLSIRRVSEQALPQALADEKRALAPFGDQALLKLREFKLL